MEQLKHEALQTIVTSTEAVLERKAQLLWRIIEQLPKRYQEVLILKMEGLKYKDIMETLGLSLKTVESQMRIAFIKTREEYREDLLLLLME